MPLSLYALSNTSILRQESFGGLVFDRKSWEIHQLNQTGYAILRLLSRQASCSREIYQYLRLTYGEIDETQKLSVDSFLERLLSLGIVTAGADNNGKINELIEPNESALGSSTSQQVARYLSAPIFVWWDITGVCNLKCKQCYSSSGMPLADEMSIEKVCDVLRQLARMNLFFIYFLGGEPFMRKDFLKILEYCRLLGIEVMISSNGWFITEGLARDLVQLGVRHIRVSIDGAKARTHDAIRGVEGSFNRAVKAIHLLKSAGIPVVGMSPTMMPDNIDEAEEIIDLAYNLGLDEIQLVQVCSVGRGRAIATLDSTDSLRLRDAIARKTNELGKSLFISGAEGVWEKPYLTCVMEGKATPGLMGCGAGRACLAISPNGKVRACLLYQYEVGDLAFQPFHEIWEGTQNPGIQQLRSIKEGCNGCTYAPLCSGPCPMQRIITAPERRCFVDSEKSKEE